MPSFISNHVLTLTVTALVKSMWCFIKKIKFIVNCIISKLPNTVIMQISLKNNSTSKNCNFWAIVLQQKKSENPLSITCTQTGKQNSSLLLIALHWVTTLTECNITAFHFKNIFSPHKAFIITKSPWRILCWKLIATTAEIIIF